MERKVLILTDGKAGHENQSKAFARALGCDFDLVEVHFKSAFHKALSYLFDRLGILTLRLFQSGGGLGEAALPSSAEAGRARSPSAPFFPANHEPRTTNHAYAAVLGTGSGTL